MKETEEQIADIICEECGATEPNGCQKWCGIYKDGISRILSEVTIEIECPECKGTLMIDIDEQTYKKCKNCKKGKITIILKEAIERLK